MPSPKRALVAVALAVTLAVGGCGDGEDRPGQVDAGSGGSATGAGEHDHGHDHGEEAGFSQGEADTAVPVQLRDFGFFGLPERVKGPKVFFSAENAGPAVHEMEIADATGKVVAGIAAFPAGQSETLAAELQPGTYTIQCRVPEGTKTHVDFGMVTQLTVE